MDLNKQIDAPLRKARESLVSKLLEKDEFGNASIKKSYADLTTPELERISESICVRLHLFAGSYPAFMPHAVKAIMEHPNLSKVDYDKLNTFSRMFELDWRGDRSINNKQEFLATNPVYMGVRDQTNFKGYGDIGNFEVTSMLRQACVPFVEDLAAKMVNSSKK